MLAAGGHGARDAPRLARGRVEGGLRASAWAACAARVRRWVRIRSITDGCVMQATRRIAPQQVGQTSGSTSNICCRRTAHRRVASVGATRGAGMIMGGASTAAGSA